MSNGSVAISGFDYQGIVILDQLFDHFDQHLCNATARPEGKDDLELAWTEDGREHHHYIQVKKPRTTIQGIRKNKPWSLSDVIVHLLPNTLKHLSTSDSRQTWILGDKAAPEVHRLVEMIETATEQRTNLYWEVVHRMARSEVLNDLPLQRRRSLQAWKYIPTPASAHDTQGRMITQYSLLLSKEKAAPELIRRYQEQVEWINRNLPGVLARVVILDDYGAEDEVGLHFQERLQREYGLPPSVVKYTLFGNLRSYVNDVAKSPGETIDRKGFEEQLRSAWGPMSSATEPPAPPQAGIFRSDLIAGISGHDSPMIIEVLGISGSGKTTLAAQSASALCDTDPNRLPVYVRVQKDATFRDVISGVAFHLLRRGIQDLFGPAVESKLADETAIQRLAMIFSGLARPVQLLLDLVDGSCNNLFGRDLGRFARALVHGPCRLIVFGQQGTFGELSLMEKESAGIHTINMRGFRQDEFVNLVGQYHPGADSGVLYNIFRRVTVGRPTGMHAQLAESLARQPSLNAMLAVATAPAEDMVSAAEQNRFNEIPTGARAAAEYLVCFALPYRKQDAEAAFQQKNVTAAIKALVELGLLRTVANGLLEMHEVVRAGLESGISMRVRRTAHLALAKWYSKQGDIATQMFHLDRAGKSSDADKLGRDTFLRGEAWRSLSSYVTRRGHITAEDIITVAARPEPIEDFYLIRFVLAELKTENADSLLVDLLMLQSSRYFRDDNWARPITEAILYLNPGRFQQLLEFILKRAKTVQEQEDCLTWLLIAASNHGRRTSSPEIVKVVKAQSEDVQHRLLPLLLNDGGRAALSLGFEIYARQPHEKNGRNRSSSGVNLNIARREDVIEILAALPTGRASMMAGTKSLAINAVGSLIWVARNKLRSFCVEILGTNDDQEVKIKISAWHVLLFIGHPDPESLVDPLSPGAIPLDHALLGPYFAAALYDVRRYERTLLNPLESPIRRQTALTILLLQNRDLDALQAQLATLPNDPVSPFWDSMFLIQCIRQPFAAAIPILRGMLVVSSTTPQQQSILLACLSAVAEYLWPNVTDLLIEGTQHKDSVIRNISITGLARRRVTRVTEVLRRQLVADRNIKSAELIAEAIAAGKPRSAGDLAGGPVSASLAHWQCIVAMRTRDESFAPQLIELATNPSAHWVLRRAAIWAAGRLPFCIALETIAPAVLAEESPLTIDLDWNRGAHSAISDLMKMGVHQFLSDGEGNFISGIASTLAGRWGFPRIDVGLPDPVDAARWLHASLMNDPTPDDPIRLLNRIQLPLLHAAVVRSMRLCGNFKGIDEILANTSSTWLAVKCLLELRWAWASDTELCSRLRGILKKSVCPDRFRLENIVDELERGRFPSGTKAPRAVVPQAPILPDDPNPRLDYSAAERALRGASLPTGFSIGKPIALAPLSREELQKLIVLADPINDPSRAVVSFTAKIKFTSDGGHVVGEESSTSAGGPGIPEFLRPAIAAANRFGLLIPWHEEQMTRSWSWSQGYGQQLLESLGTQGDANLLLEALELHADILLPILGRSHSQIQVAMALLDDRLAPILQRYLLLGGDGFFECLCNLARLITTPVAVPVMKELLSRWAARFDVKSHVLQQVGNTELWRGFARLSEHPRFHEVPSWRKTLEDVLGSTLECFRKQDIVRVIERDPGSYVVIEKLLSREENWHHFTRSEIDTLDQAAERLFHEVRD